MSTNNTKMAWMTMVHKEQFKTLKDGLLVRAPAKINLSLLVKGKRPDGFHEIETLMAKINFYDEILIQHGKKNGIELLCQGPHWAPPGKKNLVYKACEMLLDCCRSNANIKITLTKNISAGTGLGSASSDAAATLMGIKRFLKMHVHQRQLEQMASELGSDVPFFLNGPLAFCTGKGEKIKKLEKIFNFLAILIMPAVSVSTKEVYDNYQHDPATYDKLSREINTYIRKNAIDLVLQMCANVLQLSCFGLHRDLLELKKKIESLNIGPLALSGSGSAMFAVIDRGCEKKAKEYQQKIKERIGCKSIIVSNNRW